MLYSVWLGERRGSQSTMLRVAGESRVARESSTSACSLSISFRVNVRKMKGKRPDVACYEEEETCLVNRSRATARYDNRWRVSPTIRRTPVTFWPLLISARPKCLGHYSSAKGSRESRVSRTPRFPLAFISFSRKRTPLKAKVGTLFQARDLHCIERSSKLISQVVQLTNERKWSSLPCTYCIRHPSSFLPAFGPRAPLKKMTLAHATTSPAFFCRGYNTCQHHSLLKTFFEPTELTPISLSLVYLAISVRHATVDSLVLHSPLEEALTSARKIMSCHTLQQCYSLI